MGPGQSRGLLATETNSPGLHKPQDILEIKKKPKKKQGLLLLWRLRCEQTCWPNRLTSLHSSWQSRLCATDVKCQLKLVVLPHGKASPFPFMLQCFCFHFCANISGSTLENKSIGGSGCGVVSGSLQLILQVQNTLTASRFVCQSFKTTVVVFKGPYQWFHMQLCFWFLDELFLIFQTTTGFYSILYDMEIN